MSTVTVHFAMMPEGGPEDPTMTAKTIDRPTTFLDLKTAIAKALGLESEQSERIRLQWIDGKDDPHDLSTNEDVKSAFSVAYIRIKVFTSTLSTKLASYNTKGEDSCPPPRIQKAATAR
ncbi:hypothetical protein M427DRAFT_73575 [Gonapodya prolifera JEL478]|uniref:PB1 domain-containing protein n=1 Tax=Gonapodya prolifera (strain JEL478) TaxID=1344416 RepID=A0A139A2T7_GONPJ|nr:hypothetical protein M427DRAFT_73575 [Gonapodya prolifera JEL478]|eukprot:KXS10815.1 hypothetical protein M427DRAFT_73575 [Gonapodya prolifera JEL478]